MRGQRFDDGSHGFGHGLLTASGGDYFAYLRADSTARVDIPSSGNAYSVWIANPQFSSGVCSAILAITKNVSGVQTYLSYTTVPCHNGMVVRAVITDSNIILAYIDNLMYALVQDSSIPSGGRPGVGALVAPSGNAISEISFGNQDRTAPGTVNAQSVGTSAFPNHVDLQWQGVVDDANATGVYDYTIVRNGAAEASVKEQEFSDATVGYSTNYPYQIVACDFHLNCSTSAVINVTTPPQYNVDSREVGVRPTGTYWGGAGEQIDVRSGNLNFTQPLLKAMGRGGWGVQLSLSYNSQNWRQDGGGTWKLGRDVGYGYGWRLQAGSLTPYWSGFASLDHYLFIDSSGAEYRLDSNSNGVWSSSKEAVYIWYDSTAGKLHFADGSFWVLGCTSGGTEQDAGTMYPTVMENSNGNTISLTYDTGTGATGANSSGRITNITDVRGWYGFTYDYSSSPPHLQSITNYISSGESYSFTYASSVLQSPFSSSQFGPAKMLLTLQQTSTGQTTTYGYNGNTGELASMTTPFSGMLAWSYTPATYRGGRLQDEVQTRTLTMLSGQTQYPYTFKPDTYYLSNAVHATVTLNDPDGIGQKVWSFQSNGGQANVGLLMALDEGKQLNGGTSQLNMVHTAFTWAQDPAGRPYIGTVAKTLDSLLTTQTTQTLDQYGNMLTQQVYNYGSSGGGAGSLARTYTNTYVTSSTYTSAYILNRLTSSTVTDGTNTTTLSSVTYDEYGVNWGICGTGFLAAAPTSPAPTAYDSSYNTSVTIRGNPTYMVAPGAIACNTYDATGNVTATTGNGVNTTVTTNSNTNYAAPSAITTNSLTAGLAWNSFLGLTSSTGPNGDVTALAYDTSARPSSSTSPYGAVTNYTYNDSANPPTRLAVTNTHGTRTTLDGFGRTTRTETGTWANNTFTPVSAVDTQYVTCACSALGKVWRVSQPYASGGSAQNWTTYSYDGLGRTTKVVAADGSSTTSYSYQTNTVTVTDPAGNWKTYTMDVSGNLTGVLETDPNLAGC